MASMFIFSQFSRHLLNRTPQKNCWLFTSVIQQLLGYHRGSFERGKLRKRYLGRKLRSLILIEYGMFVCNARSAAGQPDVSPQHEAHSTHHAPASQLPTAQNPLQPTSPGSTEGQRVSVSNTSEGLVPHSSVSDTTPVVWYLETSCHLS